MEKSALPAYPIEKPGEKVSAHWVSSKGFAVVYLLAAVLFGFLPIIEFIAAIDYTWIKLLQIIFFILLGIGYTASSQNQVSGRPLFTLVISALIFCILFAIYFFKESGTFLLAGASAAAFLLPFVIDQSWKSFQTTSSTGNSRPWYSMRTTKEKVSVFLTGIPVQVALPVKTDDRHKKVFTSLAPSDMKLGEFFDHFLLLRNNNERQNIDVSDQQDNPYGWFFYEARMGGMKKRRLDPEANLAENDIKKNTTIIAERVIDEYEETSN